MWQKKLEEFRDAEVPVLMLLEHEKKELEGWIDEIHTDYLTLLLYTAPHLRHVRYIPLNRIVSIEVHTEISPK